MKERRKGERDRPRDRQKERAREGWMVAVKYVPE